MIHVKKHDIHEGMRENSENLFINDKNK